MFWLDKIHIKVSVFAAVVVLIHGIVVKASLTVIVPRLIAAIVMFYIIGLVVRFYLRKHVFPPEETEEAEQESETPDTEWVADAGDDEA